MSNPLREPLATRAWLGTSLHRQNHQGSPPSPKGLACVCRDRAFREKWRGYRLRLPGH